MKRRTVLPEIGQVTWVAGQRAQGIVEVLAFPSVSWDTFASILDAALHLSGQEVYSSARWGFSGRAAERCHTN